MFGYAIVPLTFILGFSLTRASTCSVAATKRLVTLGKADWLFGLLTAVSWSGVTLILLAIFLPGQAASPLMVQISWQLLLGAAVMGIGALLNQACFIGSIGKISTGNLSYLLTFAGLALAQKVSRLPILSEFINAAPIQNISGQTGNTVWILSSIFVSVAGLSIWRIRKKRTEAIIALIIMGIVAALIYASQPDWSYEAVLDRIVHQEGFSKGFVIEMAVIGLFVGAITSSTLKDRFHLHCYALKPSLMNFLGGFLMGLGARAVPGGNDSLLLWSIPGFAVHGIVAFLFMIGIMGTLIYAMKLFRVPM